MDDFEAKNQNENENNALLSEEDSSVETVESESVENGEYENEVAESPDGETEDSPENENTEDLDCMSYKNNIESDNPENGNTEVLNGGICEDGENGGEVSEDADAVKSEDGESAETESGKKKSKKKGIIAIVSAVIVVLVAVIAGLAVKLIGTGSAGFKAKDTVLTVDNVDVSAGEFSFYYSYMYSYYYQYIMYGQATTDDIKDMAVNEIAFSSAVYAIAQKEGFELSQEQINTNVTETIKSYRDYAEENDMTLNEFLSKYYGKGFNEKLFTEIITKNAVATLYKQKVDDEIVDSYFTEDGLKKINEEYAKNKKNYDTLAIKYYYFADPEEGQSGTSAKENAEKLVSLVKGGQTFTGALYNNFKDENYSYSETECPSVPVCTYETLVSLAQDAADWSFEQDAKGDYVRKIGDMKIIESNSMQYVIYIDSLPAKDETHQVSYRDIFVSFGDGEQTEEVLNTTKAKADEILKTYSDYIKANPDDNADNYFALLASSKSENSQTAQNGGLVENVTTASTEADKWALEKDRKTGDTSVIKDTDGYHVVYYTDSAEHPVWVNTIANALAQSESQTKFADCENAKDRAVIKEEKISSIIKFIEDAMTSENETEDTSAVQ